MDIVKQSLQLPGGPKGFFLIRGWAEPPAQSAKWRALLLAGHGGGADELAPSDRTDWWASVEQEHEGGALRAV